MKLIGAILILAASLAAQDTTEFKGTISGLAAEPAPYVPDESLGYTGGIILDTTAKPAPVTPGVVALFVPVPVLADQPAIFGGAILTRPRPVAVAHFAPAVAARRR